MDTKPPVARRKLFGCGSVAQAVLSKGSLGEPLTIHIGFTLGVMMAVYMAGGVSGAHVNPAVSLAMVILGKLPLKKFPVYVVAQFLGAFTGSCIVFGLYYDALMDYTYGELAVAGENATTKIFAFSPATAKIFASYPAKHLSVLNGFADQVIATAALILCILAITDKKNIGAPTGMEPLCIGLVIMAIGVSMGLNCGYPINPARDLGPRFFTALAGWGMDVFRAGGCWWWIPVTGPMVGGAVGAGIYFLFIELHHPEPEKQEENSVQDKYEMVTMS
uniref:Aquaporin 9b n=1 Tax=Monopterus albus TaxID=43700 RepID=A0A3Q3KMP9_MONAL|nr:aquaporin-9 isoform X2 [Monopterus albus]